MKTRADFVTNSSSSSYVDIYADNPALNELLKKYNIAKDDAYFHCSTDWCSSSEDLVYSDYLTEFLELIGGIDSRLQVKFEEKQALDNGFQEELKEKEATLVKGFRYAKYNTGFSFTDGMLAGEEHHITLSSRWGVVDQYTRVDVSATDQEADEDDDENDDVADDEDEFKYLVPNLYSGGDGWEYVVTRKKGKPNEEIADFTGAKPEDLVKKNGLSRKMKLVIDNLSSEPVVIKGKKFAFMGDYDQEDDEENRDEWDHGPWDDREGSIVIEGNIPEIGLISLWLTPLEGKIKPIRSSRKIGSADYVVVRLDSWAERYIDTKVIREACSNGIPIISEYQLWKAIFQ